MLVFGHNISARILVTFSITVTIKVLCKVGRSHATAGIRPAVTYIIVIVFIGMRVFGHNVSTSITNAITVIIVMFATDIYVAHIPSTFTGAPMIAFVVLPFAQYMLVIAFARQFVEATKRSFRATT